MKIVKIINKTEKVQCQEDTAQLIGHIIDKQTEFSKNIRPAKSR